MGDLDQNPPGPPVQGADLIGQAESLAKLTALFSVFVYGCGLLVVSIAQGEHGFSDLNPFHARVVMAGIWVVVFIGIPAFAVTTLSSSQARLRVEGQDQVKANLDELKDDQRAESQTSERKELSHRAGDYVKGKAQSGFSKSFAIFIYALLCMSLGRLFEDNFVYHPINFFGPTVAEHPEKWGAELINVTFWIALAFNLIGGWKKLPRALPALSSVAFVVSLAIVGIRQLFSEDVKTAESFALWFLVIGLVVAGRRRFFGSSLRFEDINWYGCVSAVPLFLGTFATFYYPRINPAWGGGAPIQVLVHFKGDSAGLIDRGLSARLLDATDQGFYFVARGESFDRATFIARTEVSIIDYEEHMDFFHAHPTPYDLDDLRERLTDRPSLHANSEPCATVGGASTNPKPDASSPTTRSTNDRVQARSRRAP